MLNTKKFLAPATACAVLIASSVVAGEKTHYQKLADSTKPALVTIKFVLKVQGPRGPREVDREFTALMIEKEGLVLCSSVQLGTSKLLKQRMGGVATPTDIKVLIGDDTEGVEARLLTTDADLDLSWIQIKKPSSEGYAFIDLSNHTTPALGDDILSVNRMDKFYDHAIKIEPGLISGSTSKPRDLLIPNGSLDVNPGMPVYDAGAAALVGIVVIQAPDPEDMGSSSRVGPAALILPAAEVVKATKRAKATAASEEEDEDEEEEEEEEEPKATDGAKQPAKDQAGHTHDKEAQDHDHGDGEAQDHDHKGDKKE